MTIKDDDYDLKDDILFYDDTKILQNATSWITTGIKLV